MDPNARVHHSEPTDQAKWGPSEPEWTSNILQTGPDPHWTLWLQILSELCFQRVALSGNYEIVAISTDKNTFFNDHDYKAEIRQHFLGQDLFKEYGLFL